MIMALAGIELRYLVDTISEQVQGYYVSNIYGITKDSILFKLHHTEKSDLFMMISTSGVWLTAVKIDQMESNRLLKRLRSDLLRLKLKKIEQIGDPNDSKKESIEDIPAEVPEIEKTEPEAPSGEPPVSAAEKSEKDKKLNKLFWMRVALAIIAGTSATFIFEDIEGEDRRWASIGFMIGIFFATVIIAKR